MLLWIQKSFRDISLDSSPWRTNVTSYGSPGNRLVQVWIFLNLSNGFLLIRCDRYKTTAENMLSPDKRRRQGTVARKSQTGDRKENIWRVDWYWWWTRGIFCSVRFYIKMIEVTNQTKPNIILDILKPSTIPTIKLWVDDVRWVTIMWQVEQVFYYTIWWLNIKHTHTTHNLFSACISTDHTLGWGRL